MKKKQIHEVDIQFFKDFSQINANRSKQMYDSLLKWNKADWALCICGESGELAEYIKKEKRDNKDNSKKIKKEIADIFMYLDLFCTSQGYNFAQLIINKFNEISKRKKIIYL